MDPLPQYGSHAFFAYPSPSSALSQSPPSPSSSSSFSGSHSKSPAPFSLKASTTWTYTGPLLSPSSASLPPSFHTWSRATIDEPSSFLLHFLPFLEFVNQFLKQANVSCYWLSIRATHKPVKEFEEPRWHVDDDFFLMEKGNLRPQMLSENGKGDGVGNEMEAKEAKEAKETGTGSIWEGIVPGFLKTKKTEEVQEKTMTVEEGSKGNMTQPRRYWKLCTTLLGAPTLFLPKNDLCLLSTIQNTCLGILSAPSSLHDCPSIACSTCFRTSLSIRHSLTSQFSHITPESAKPGELSFFRVGMSEGAIHSEPPHDGQRLFVNVVPGTEEELREMSKKWGMGWPRGWCLGVPGWVEGVEDERWSREMEQRSEAGRDE